MRRLLLLAGVCAALSGAGLAVTALPAAARHTQRKPRVTVCHSVDWAPQSLRIKHVVAQATTCDVARGLAKAYMNATTESSGPDGRHTGHCFGPHSYGRCNGVRFAHRAWSCFHFLGTRKGQRGLVNCTRSRSRVNFNVRY